MIGQLTGTAGTMSGESITRFRELRNELHAPNAERSRFADLVRIPGVGGYGWPD